MVRELQQHYYDGKYYGVEMLGNPDFSKIASAYSIESVKVEKETEIYPEMENIRL